MGRIEHELLTWTKAKTDGTVPSKLSHRLRRMMEPWIAFQNIMLILAD